LPSLNAQHAHLRVHDDLVRFHSDLPFFMYATCGAARFTFVAATIGMCAVNDTAAARKVPVTKPAPHATGPLAPIGWRVSSSPCTSNSARTTRFVHKHTVCIPMSSKQAVRFTDQPARNRNTATCLSNRNWFLMFFVQLRIARCHRSLQCRLLLYR
jgi:hypothetical protein